MKLQVGDFLSKKTGYTAIRRVVSFDEAMPQFCRYREYHAGVDCELSETAIDGSCLESSLLNWGKVISAELARRAVPNMDTLDRNTDLKNHVENEALTNKNLSLIPTDRLLQELEARGVKT